MEIVDNIAAEIKSAGKNKKIATLHCQFLLHANSLKDMNPELLCQDIGESAKYATEIRKMRALKTLMDESGIKIILPDGKVA